MLVLIAGLPKDSRYVGRLLGEESSTGWSDWQWLLFDLRNSVEALRAMRQSEGKKSGKPDYREWGHYPGAAVEKRRKRAAKIDKWKSVALKG